MEESIPTTKPWLEEARPRRRGTADRRKAESPAPPSIALFLDGIKVLHGCANALVEICFVHGLIGDREWTWTADGQPDPWPKSIAPAEASTSSHFDLLLRCLRCRELCRFVASTWQLCDQPSK